MPRPLHHPAGLPPPAIDLAMNTVFASMNTSTNRQANGKFKLRRMDRSVGPHFAAMMHQESVGGEMGLPAAFGIPAPSANNQDPGLRCCDVSWIQWSSLLIKCNSLSVLLPALQW